MFKVQLLEKIRKVVKNSQPALVIFKDVVELNKFNKAADWDGHGLMDYDIQYLTEKIDKEDRKTIIRSCATAEKITLATASFGRGTDFTCRDQ